MSSVQSVVSGTSYYQINSNGGNTGGIDPPLTNSGGALKFSNSYITFDASSSWQLGTGDFTIEWFQWAKSFNTYARVFSVGNWPASVGVSLEGSNTFYFWLGGSAAFSFQTTLMNQWVHYAVSRSSGTLRVYENGVLKFVGASSLDANDNTDDLYIGAEGTLTPGVFFDGYISNFRLIKGFGIYDQSSLTVPTTKLSEVTGTQILLQTDTEIDAFKDSCVFNRSVKNNSGVTWYGASPFG